MLCKWSRASLTEADKGGGGGPGRWPPLDVRRSGAETVGQRGQGGSRAYSAPLEQTWLMWQMWSTHTAVTTELRLLRQGMDHMHKWLYWAEEGESEGGILDVTGEEETME